MVMSNGSTLLLPDVMSKVAELDPAALAAVHQFLLKLELARLSEEIQDEAEAFRQVGSWETDLIDAAVREHRHDHPYGR